MTWVGSRRMIDEHPEFNAEIDPALREYRGPGVYKHTGEQIAPIPESDKNTGVDSSGRVIWRPQLFWIKTKEEYNSMWDLKSS